MFTSTARQGRNLTRGRKTTEGTEDTEKQKHNARGPQPNGDGGWGLAGNSLPWRHENLRARGRFQRLVVRRRKTTEGTEDTEKTKHNAREPQRNGDGGWGLAGNSLAWRHENLRARRRFQGLAVQRKAEGTEKENHRGHRGHGGHGGHREKQTTEVGKEGTETLGRTLGKVRLQGERWVRRARKKQTTENTEKNKPRRTQRGRAATKQAWRLWSRRQLAPGAA